MRRWRHFTVVGCFVLACLAIVGRVGYLNVTQRDFLQQQGDARSIRSETVPAYRGLVFDRYGEPLAVSTPVVAVWMDPSRNSLGEADVSRLAALLDLDADRLQAELAASAHREFLYLRRRVSLELAGSVRALGLNGVYFQNEYRRYYPAGETTAHVVGMTGVDDAGLEGVELSFDEVLRGQSGRKVVLKDRRGDTVKDLSLIHI